jgi:class 3 adenylate cyclase
LAVGIRRGIPAAVSFMFFTEFAGAKMRFREYHYHWEHDFKSSPEQLWPLVADTNRFNRDTGLPQLEFEKSKRRLRNARRKVRLSMHGLPVEWEEQPFEWVRPERFGIERIYSRGPLTRMRVLVELSRRDDGGTHLTYDVWATPRNMLGAVAIPMQIKLSNSPKFSAAFKRYDSIALKGLASEVAMDLSGDGKGDLNRLAALKQKLLADVAEDARDVVERLIEFIQRSDDLAVGRIRPYELADKWNEPRKKVLEVCLRATRIGLLDFQWNLLCPLCRGPQHSSSSLKDIESDVHCETCKIDFTVNFDRFVELTFRPNAAVRRVEMAEFCVGSPTRTPHVVAQQLLPAGEVRTLNLPLEIGNYRLRALELQVSQFVTVTSDGETDVSVTLDANGIAGDQLMLAPRSQLTIRNETDSEQLLILERMAWSDQATTAAEVTALQTFRDLFSSEALRPGEQISVGTLTVLFTDLRNSTKLYREIGDATAFGRVMSHFDILKKAISSHDGAIVKTIGDAVMAVFRCPADGVEAMLEVQELLASPPDGGMPLALKAGLHTGPCIAVTLNDRLDYFGSTVNMAARLEGLSSGLDVIVSQNAFDDPKVQDLLLLEGYSAERFEMSLKGFEDENVELWRVRRTSGAQASSRAVR